MLLTDTVRLRKAAEQMLPFFGQKEDKARLLYYLGRNYSVINKDNTAVDYYIAADRLHPDDKKLQGRLYSNMAYICAQQNKDSLALVFYDKGSRIWEELDNRDYYTANLLDMSLSYCKINKISQSDSVWQIANRYANSEYLLSRAMGIRAYYYNSINKYDSALYCLNQITLPEVLDEDFCDAQKAIALFYTGDIDSSVCYAKRIIANQTSTRNQIIAYTVLREKAYRDNDIAAAMKRDDMVEELQKTIDSENEQRTLAINKIERYLSEERNCYWIWISVSVLCVVVCIVVMFLYHHKHKIRVRALTEKDERLNTQETTIKAIVNQQKKTAEDNIQKLQDCKDWMNILSWNDDTKSHAKIDLYFNNFATRLSNNYNLNIVDIKYCTMLLLNFDSRYISENLPYSYSGIKTLKKRIANKLFILPQDMSVFLADFVLLTEDIGAQAKM